MSEQVEERLSTQPAGILLGRFALLVILAFLILAAWYDQFVIVIALAVVLAAAGITRLWSQFSLSGVTCERSLGERRVFPGEYIDLKLRLFNRKLLPLPWIQIDDEIPAGFTPGTALVPTSRLGYGFLSKTVALFWYTGVSWNQRLYGLKRGYYALGPITLTSGDIFGFYPRSTTKAIVDHIIVYPKLYPMAQLGIPPLYPIGETTAERRIFEDPIRVIGVRDYTPHDSLRHIHWKASARHQHLQVKVFEPTTTLTAAVFVAVDSFPHETLRDKEFFELGISTAASVASHVIERHSAAGLFVNSRLADSGQPVEILPGSSTEQLVRILEALAKVTNKASASFEEFLQTERMGLPWGTTFIFVISRPSPALNNMLSSLKESGQRLMVLQVGGTPESAMEHVIAWHNIKQPGDFTKITTEAIK